MLRYNLKLFFRGMTPENNIPARTKDEEMAQFKLVAEVFTRFQEKQELPDGYALRYPKSSEWNARLERFCHAWRQSCPYFNFALIPEARNGAVWLHITGPEGTKGFVESANEILTSNLNPAPNLKNTLKRKIAHWTQALRVLPDFLIIGAKKCGTTSLYSYLTQHPGVAPARNKEIYFFDSSKNFNQGLRWYRAFFPTALAKFYAQQIRRQPFLTGEASPEYILHPKAPKRIFQAIPRVKLLAILRNPIDRAYSHYQHHLRSARENLSFEGAIERELAKQRADAAYFDKDQCYLAGGVYVEQLKAWKKYFPPEQMLVVANEALDENPSPTVAPVFAFLNLPPFELKTYKKLNAFPYPDMAPATRRGLIEYFKPHNQRLYKFLDRDFNWDK